MNKLTTWKGITERDGYRGPAVYQMRFTSEGQPIPIGRLLGTDQEGLVCIGGTTDLRARLSQFLSGIDRCYGHSSANMIYLIMKYSILIKKYPNIMVEYSYDRVVDGEEASRMEAVRIKAYTKKYGEPPPLNSAIPDRYGEWGGEENPP